MAPTTAQSPSTKSPGSRAHNQKKSTRARKGTITPIIKIVHVYAPTLVQTDVANFRTLVQEMTGNDGAAAHNSKDLKAICSTLALTDDETASEDKQRAENSRMSQAQPCEHREGESSTSTGAASLAVQGKKKERKTYAAYVSEEEGEVCEYGDMESSCEQSVDSFFSEVYLEDDHPCKMQPQQAYCGAYFTTTSSWRPPLQEIPGGFESFDCF